MELDELKANWKSVNNRLDEMQAVQAAMQNRELLGRTKKVTNQLKIQPIFELIIGCVTAVWTGNFLADNFSKIQQSPLSATPEFLLDALAIFTIWLSIRQLIMVSSLDYSNSIVETQKKVAELRALRVRFTQIAFLSMLPLWMIFPIVAGQALFGINFVHAVNGPWLLANAMFGLIASAGLVVAARKFGEKSLIFQKINDLIAGAEIVRAQKFLAELNAFERS